MERSGGRDSQEVWDGHVLAESLCCPPEIVITLLISYTPTQNKKCFFCLFVCLFLKKNLMAKKQKQQGVPMSAPKSYLSSSGKLEEKIQNAFKPN